MPMNADPPPAARRPRAGHPDRRADRAAARGAGGDALVARRPVDRAGGPGAVRDRGRDPADARLGAAAPARRRGDVPRRGLDAHRPVAAGGRGPPAVRRHARRAAAPPPIREARRPRRRPRVGRGGAGGAPDRARRARGADAQLEPVQHLAAAARGRPLRVAQGRAAVLRPRGRHAPPSPGRRRSAAPGARGRPGPARRRAGRRPVRRGRARAPRDGDDAGRPPGGLDRSRRRPPAHRAARLARAGAYGPHRRRRPTPFRGARRR